MCVFGPKCQWCNWHLSFLAMLPTSGKESRTSLTASSSQEGEECAQEERGELKEVLKPVSHRALVAELRKQMVTPLESCHTEALSSSDAAMHNARPKVNLLNILQQGWDLRSVCNLGRRSNLPPALCCFYPHLIKKEKKNKVCLHKSERVETYTSRGWIRFERLLVYLCHLMENQRVGVQLVNLQGGFTACDLLSDWS